MPTTHWLAQYDTLLDLSQQMRAAAGRQDWETLTRLGDTRNTLASSLPPALPPLPDNTKQTIAERIRDILECDQEIEARVIPWLQHTGKLLAVLGRNSASSPPEPG